MLGFGGLWPISLRPRAAAAAGAALGVLFAVLAACSGSTSTALPPTTGVLIRAETLTSGKGCGAGPSQIFKYVVVVYGYGGQGDPAQPVNYQAAVTTNVFDCYTDGAFISLPTTNGSSTFRLEVFAYDQAAYNAQKGAVEAASAIGLNRTANDHDRLVGYSGELLKSSPTWTTECSATQQQNVLALADCKPLAAGASGVGGTAATTTITLDTSKFVLPNGRKAACANAPADGGVADGGDLDASASDADAGASDGGAALGFAGVRIRTRIAAQIVADTVVNCPAPYGLPVAPSPTRYDLDIGLLDSAGNLVDPAAITMCSATSVTGTTSSAVCP